MIGTACTANAESVMKACGDQWKAAKAAGTTNEETWPEFLARLMQRFDNFAFVSGVLA